MRTLPLLAMLCATTALAQMCPSVNSRFTVCQNVPPISSQFVWTVLYQQNDFADVGENVVLYSQQNKFGAGPAWGSVSEARCNHPRGGCAGQEIDLVVNGPLQFGDWRIGQSIVLWRVPGTDGVPSVNYGLLVASEWNDRENIRAEVGIGIDTRNNIAALRIRSGEKIALDDEGRITFRFNPAAQTIEFANGDRVIWSIPVN